MMKCKPDLLIFLVILCEGILHILCQEAKELHIHSSGEDRSAVNYSTINTPFYNNRDGKLDDNITQVRNFTNIKQLNDSTYDAVEKDKVDNVIEHTQTWVPDEPPRELPLSIIITASGVAVGIMLFLCIAFYFHNAQLNKKAQRFSMTLYVTQESYNSERDVETAATQTLPLIMTNIPASPQTKCIPRINSSPNINNINGLPRNVSTPNFTGFPRNVSSPNAKDILPRDSNALNIRNFRDPEVIFQQRKSTISLGLPSRGSTLSAYTDQEIANQSAKRKHSVFIL